MNKSIAVKSSRLNSIIAFLIGFLSANNIVYVFSVGNTTIKAIAVVALIGLAIIAVNNHGRLLNPFYMLPQSLRLSFAFILLSFVPVLLFNRDTFYQWFVGIIAFLLMCFVAAIVLLLYDDYKEYIYNGIYWGMIINTLLILIGLFNFSRGISFTLAEFFPAETIANVYLGHSYRGSGLFREGGHLMRYVAVMGFPLMYYYKGNKKKMLIAMISMIIILAYTRSSTAVVFGLEVAILILIFVGKNARSFWRALAAIVAVIIAAVVITPIRNFMVDNIFSGFIDITTYRIQTTRLTGIRSAIKVAEQYPIIGSGWNTLSKIFQKMGYNVFISNGFGGGEYLSAAFSEGLTMLAELGIFSFFYYWFIIKSSVSLLRNRDSLSVALGVSLIGYFLLFFITDFSFNLNGCVAVLIGLSIGRMREMTNEGEPSYSMTE